MAVAAILDLEKTFDTSSLFDQASPNLMKMLRLRFRKHP
jgi:hypothetical protein